MRYVVRRGGVAVIVLLLAVSLNFVVIRAAPGDYSDYLAAARIGAAPSLSDEAREELRKSFGLDEPIPVQFARYLGQTAKGNFGNSFTDGRPIRGKLWTAMKNTLSMVVLGVVAGMLLGIALGTVAGSASGGWLDGTIVAIASLVYALPAQLIGMVLLVLLAGTFQVFPVGGREDPFALGTGFWAHQSDVLQHMALPSLTLALVTVGSFALVARSWTCRRSPIQRG